MMSVYLVYREESTGDSWEEQWTDFVGLYGVYKTRKLAKQAIEERGFSDEFKVIRIPYNVELLERSITIGESEHYEDLYDDPWDI